MSVERLCGEELMLTDDLLLETDLLGAENPENQEEQQEDWWPPSSTPCEKCLAINQATRRLFGVRDTVVPTCECLDICVQNVRLICTRNFSQTINLGSAMGCRGGNCVLPTSCRVVVLCHPNGFYQIVVEFMLVLGQWLYLKMPVEIPLVV